MTGCSAERYAGDGMGADEFRMRYSYGEHTLYTNTEGLSPEIGRSVSTGAMADRVRCYVHLTRVCRELRGRISEAYGAGVASLADAMSAAPSGSAECQAVFDRVWAALDAVSSAEKGKCIEEAVSEVDELEKEMNAGGLK